MLRPYTPLLVVMATSESVVNEGCHACGTERGDGEQDQGQDQGLDGQMEVRPDRRHTFTDAGGHLLNEQHRSDGEEHQRRHEV